MQSREDKIFDLVNHILIVLMLLVILYPLYYIVIASFSKTTVGTYFWPNGFTVKGYLETFRYKPLWSGYANTLFYTIGGVLIGLFCTLLLAYAISRNYFVGGKLITILVMIPMFVSGGLIPTYLTVMQLGLVGSRFYILIAGAVSTYNVIVARTFFRSTIPEELYEASLLDGCKDGRFFLSIVIPLSKPIIAVEALYLGVAKWNSYMTEMIYLSDEKKYPLALVLKRLLWSITYIQAQLEGNAQGAENLSQDVIVRMQEKADLASVMQYCIILLSTVPMLLIYPYLQKYFAKGVMIGAVKG